MVLASLRLEFDVFASLPLCECYRLRLALLSLFIFIPLFFYFTTQESHLFGLLLVHQVIDSLALVAKLTF